MSGAVEASQPERRFLRLARRVWPRFDAMLVLAAIPALAIVALLAGTLWISLRESVFDPTLTLRHYAQLYADPFGYAAFRNTLGFSFWTLLIAFLFGVPIAWLAERSDVKGRSLIFALMTLGIFIPSFFTAMGWLFLLHPKIGMINIWLMGLFGLEAPPFTIISVPGMGLIQGLGLASVVFVLTTASLRAMDARLEESARMSGASFFRILRRITLPLAWPGLLAAALYVFTIGIGAFDVPLVVGLSNRIYTFSTYLYVMSNPLNGVPRYGIVAAFAAFMILFALLLSWWYSRVLLQARKYQIVTGKAYPPQPIRLGRWQAAAWGFVLLYLLASKLMPLVMMIWASLLPYFQPFSAKALASLSWRNYTALDWSLLSRGLANTVILMLAVPALALAMSLVFSWVVLRSRSRLRLGFDFIAFLPHAVPSSIFAFVALVLALLTATDSFDLSGSLTIVVLVMAIVMLSFGSRITNGALIQIHPELEEAAYLSGASTFGVLRRVTLPLLKPALLFGFLWIALLSSRELTIPTILFSPDNIAYSVAAWSLWNGGSLTAAAAANLILLVLLLPLVILYMYYTGRMRAGA